MPWDEVNMGLLDNIDDPRTQAILSMGFGLLNSRGNLGQGIGQAGPQALQAFQQAKQAQQQRAMQAQQMEAQQQQLQMQRAAMEQQQAQAQRQAAIQQAAQQKQAGIEDAYRGAFRSPAQVAMAGNGGPTMAAAQATQNTEPQIDQQALIRRLSQVDPVSAYQMMQPKPEDMKVVGDALIGVAGGKARELYRAPEKAHKPTASIEEFLYAQQNPAFGQWDLSRKKAGAASTNLKVGGFFEKEYDKDQGKSFSEAMTEINKAAFQAPSQIRKLERMEALLDGVDGGKLAPVGLEIASWANSVGIKMDPKLGNKEAAQALSRDIAGGFRKPGTGPTTDKDFDNFLLQVPDLSKSAEGRKQIMITMKAAAARDIQLAKMARDYEKKNGKLDNGFYSEASQYIAENPVVGMPSGWKVR